MKHNWEYKTFGSLCNIVRGGSPRPIQDYLTDSAEGLNWIKIGDVAAGSKYIIATKEKIKREGLVKTRQVFKGDFILSNSMSFGRPYILKIDGCIHDGWLAIKGVENHFIPDFLYYYLSAPSTYSIFEKLVKGGVVSNLNSDIVKGIDVPLPTIDMQRQIVAELDQINDLIAKNRELLSQLDALAQSLFYDYFSSIDEYVPLSHYVNSLVGGKSLAGKEFCKNRVLKSGAITYDYFDKNSTKFLPLDYIPSPEHSVKIGDLIISRMNTAELVGACAYVFDVDENVYLPDRLWRIEYKSNANPIFLWKSLIAEPVKEQIRAKASGTSGTMKNISKPLLLSVKLKKVPLELQEKFAARIEEIEEQKKVVENTIAELQTLLDSRMDYWFN